MNDAYLQSWLNDIYDATRDRQEEYYEDTVTLLCMLVMTGNYWDPAAGPLPIPAVPGLGMVALTLLTLAAGMLLSTRRSHVA